MPRAPITNIIFGTMTLGYRGYGARVHDAATADAMLGSVLEFGHDQLDTCADYGDGTCEPTLTDMTASHIDSITPAIPLKRVGDPDEIAGLVAYLASGESGYMTGSSLTIDGEMAL
jgi:NAD(P)-dependent dehydrogenase (short-subunit alcohol dehydrogenase family)